jgi:hypothetical protein
VRKLPNCDKASKSLPIFVRSEVDDFGFDIYQARLVMHVARRGTCFAEIKTIAQICQIKPRTVRKKLQQLVNLRVLDAKFEPGKATKYRLNPLLMWRAHPNTIGIGVGKDPNTIGIGESDTFGPGDPHSIGTGYPSTIGPDEGSPLKVLPEGSPLKGEGTAPKKGFSNPSKRKEKGKSISNLFPGEALKQIECIETQLDNPDLDEQQREALTKKRSEAQRAYYGVDGLPRTSRTGAWNGNDRNQGCAPGGGKSAAIAAKVKRDNDARAAARGDQTPERPIDRERREKAAREFPENIQPKILR